MAEDTNNNELKILSIDYLKSKLTKWRIISFILFLTLIYNSLGVFANSEKKPKAEYIARINLHGMIMSGQQIVEKLDSLIKDKNVRGLLLDVDSPGGAILPSYKLYEKVIEFKEKTNKPVVTVMGSTAASGGYLVSVAADHIIAHHSTVTGSIGVLLMSPDVTGLEDKVGVKVNIFKSGPLKASPNPAEKLSPEASTMIAGVVEDMKKSFISVVAKEREITDRAIIAKISDAGIFTGNQAKEIGLIDELGGIPEAEKWLVDKNNGKKYELFDVSFRKKDSSFVNKLLGSNAEASISKFITNLLLEMTNDTTGFYLIK